MPDNCPICLTLLKVASKAVPGKDAQYISCQCCGEFYLSGTLFAMLPETLKGNEEKRAILSHSIRKMQRQNQKPFLDTINLTQILNSKLPSPSQQADNFILWLGENLPGPGEEIWIEPETHKSIMGAKSPEGFALVLKHLFKKELLTGNLSETLNMPGRAYVTLSMEGWDYFEEFKRGAKDSRKAFMAMKFGDKALDGFVEEYFKPAVEQNWFSINKAR